MRAGSMFGLAVLCAVSTVAAVVIVGAMLHDMRRERPVQYQSPPDGDKTYEPPARDERPEGLTQAEFRAKCIADVKSGKAFCASCGGKKTSLRLTYPEQVWICADRETCRRIMAIKSQLESTA